MSKFSKAVISTALISAVLCSSCSLSSNFGIVNKSSLNNGLYSDEGDDNDNTYDFYSTCYMLKSHVANDHTYNPEIENISITDQGSYDTIIYMLCDTNLSLSKEDYEVLSDYINTNSDSNGIITSAEENTEEWYCDIVITIDAYRFFDSYYSFDEQKNKLKGVMSNRIGDLKNDDSIAKCLASVYAASYFEIPIDNDLVISYIDKYFNSEDYDLLDLYNVSRITDIVNYKFYDELNKNNLTHKLQSQVLNIGNNVFDFMIIVNIIRNLKLDDNKLNTSVSDKLVSFDNQYKLKDNTYKYIGNLSFSMIGTASAVRLKENGIDSVDIRGLNNFVEDYISYEYYKDLSIEDLYYFTYIINKIGIENEKYKQFIDSIYLKQNKDQTIREVFVLWQMKKMLNIGTVSELDEVLSLYEKQLKNYSSPLMISDIIFLSLLDIDRGGSGYISEEELKAIDYNFF